MNASTIIRPEAPSETELWQMRVDLAAAFRLAAAMDWHEAVGNHFSLAVSADGAKFLLNPHQRHFSQVRASELLLLDSNDAQTMSRPGAPDPSAWCIHGRIHANLPRARCVLHLHPPYATALATLSDPSIKAVDQNTARFHNRIAIDRGFDGIADFREEGERLVQVLGSRRYMMMGNHGVLVTGDTVAQAFDDMYFLERAARTLVLAYSTGQPLNVMSDALAEKTARGWDAYQADAFAHFAQLKTGLDRTDPSYAT
ncbi:MAG: class II aldolase/adducin family protein [Proteobacteria bacterium]|nr:class II aldolase/adducin family protein [Pseudomonadota bacterium]